MLNPFDLSLPGTFPFVLSCASAAKFVFPAHLTAQRGTFSLSLPRSMDLLSPGSRRRDAPRRCTPSVQNGACLGAEHGSVWRASNLLPVGATVSWLVATFCLCRGGLCGCSAWLNSTRTAFESACVQILPASCIDGTSVIPEPVLCFRED